MKIKFIVLLLLSSADLILAQEIEFPIAKKTECSDTFFKTYTISDNYRWLENTDSADVKKWIREEERISDKFLTQASNKYNSELTIRRYAYTQYNHPVKKGNYFFERMISDDFSTASLYYQRTLNDESELLVDPNLISRKDKIVIKDYDVSKNSEWLAYQFSRNGSDWAEARIVSLKTGKEKEDHLDNLKFSNISWKGDGFFYSTFPKTGKFGKTEGEKVFFHKLGDGQLKDSLIFSRKNPNLQFSYFTTSDERFFILNETNEEAGTHSIYYIDYNSKEPHLLALLTNLKYELSIINNYGDDFIAFTTYKADNGSVIKISIATPYKWQTIVPEYTKALLTGVWPLDGKIMLMYQADFRPMMLIVDYKGAELFNMEFPIGTSVNGFSGNSDDEELLFNYTSYTVPPVVYKFNVKTYKKELTRSTIVTFDYDKIDYKEVEYAGKDGVKIPMIIICKKGMKQDGSNPTILTAYGGFGHTEQASFDPGIVYFIEQGGIYAFANIRGGGDKGKSWADAGKGENKQTSFDDFISAAQYLIKEGYTNPKKLASTGASNGGLVVAVAAIQRPDLFKAVVPEVAPTDMLRFQKFTVGHWHADEYGTTDDSLSFTKLLSYSPLHNIKENINYPAMLLMTSENDDRVPPFHSYKFVAALQTRKAQTNPILLRIEKKAGHNGSSTWASVAAEQSEKFGFIMKLLNEE